MAEAGTLGALLIVLDFVLLGVGARLLRRRIAKYRGGMDRFGKYRYPVSNHTRRRTARAQQAKLERRWPDADFKTFQRYLGLRYQVRSSANVVDLDK